MTAPMALLSNTETVLVRGRRVRVLRVAGPDGPPPVLVLHGWGASIEAVRGVAAGLAPAMEVVAVDLPGFGESDPPDEPWGVPDYADFVLELCDELGLRRVSIVGHSFGARIALVIGASAPERVARLVLTGAAGLKPRRKPSYYAKVATAKLGRAVGALGGPPGRRLQQRMRARVASADWLAASEAMRGTFRAVVTEDLGDRLEHVRAATLLIWGSQDQDTPLWMARRMEREIPDAGLVVLDGAGHYAYAERAAEFNRVAAHFLGEAR